MSVSPYSTSILGSEVDGEIRLISLKPGLFGTPIYACLIVKPLRSTGVLAGESPHHQYEAISYVWGAQSKKRVIFLEDLPFEISANLETAL